MAVGEGFISMKPVKRPSFALLHIFQSLKTKLLLGRFWPPLLMFDTPILKYLDI